MQLGAMFAIWYILNIYFNIFNKQVLKVYSFPATVTAFHFGCGTLMILIMWASNLYHRPKLTRSQDVGLNHIFQQRVREWGLSLKNA
ncbi:hypothetical protein GOBAR_AA39380 [Gossypium barbadense]|uniref:Sugar phosphate transporter domain-containing protein n=1 Tax=Gossypium barbadense TaxID=3634 RepID=A0A2P5VR64_GOSBA|nr:hypothetical protein GOBAR_AA39380 [Gossypium barbadense]